MHKAPRTFCMILGACLALVPVALLQGCHGGEAENAGKVGEVTGPNGTPLTPEARAALEKSKNEPKEASPFSKGRK